MSQPRPRPATRGRFKAFRPLTTRWVDNDAFGHVNNAVYYSYFDTALTAWLVERGLLHPSQGSHVFVVAENGCRFHHELAFPEPLEVGLAVARLGSSSVRWEMAVFRPAEDVAAAEGHFVHVHVERATRRPEPIPGPARALMQAMLAHGDGGHPGG